MTHVHKRNRLPVVVTNLYVKYHVPQKDGTTERLIPCHSWDECGRHEEHFAGIADTERRGVEVVRV